MMQIKVTKHFYDGGKTVEKFTQKEFSVIYPLLRLTTSRYNYFIKKCKYMFIGYGDHDLVIERVY